MVQEAPVPAREFEGREVNELSFSQFNLEFGDLKALDYFDDGSFYLLSAPGHAIGHLNALARTTENTFISFAADTIHHISELRPHIGSHLPQSVQMPDCCCAGAALHKIHPANGFSKGPEYYYHATLGHPHSTPDEVPFHTVSQSPSGEALSVNLQEARDTIRAVQKFDSDPNVFCGGGPWQKHLSHTRVFSSECKWLERKGTMTVFARVGGICRACGFENCISVLQVKQTGRVMYVSMNITGCISCIVRL